MVHAGRASDRASADYLKSFYSGNPSIVCKIPAENNGRMFYNEKCTKLDYDSFKGRIDETLDAILEGINKADSPAYYIASNIIDTHLPGFNDNNNIVIP